MGNGEEKAGHLFTSEDLITGYNRQKKTILKKKYHKDIKKGSPLSDITNINLQPLEKGKMKVSVLENLTISYDDFEEGAEYISEGEEYWTDDDFLEEDDRKPGVLCQKSIIVWVVLL
ncbi:uncharacterized protein LOC141693722 isoform X2 [Apium graveolens]|uniref:uncharacterized protein LOC141693722 isoform X2 n=1 Tax=Apium graveolens TaxID=4045 RepID=UPI003D7A5CE2